MKKLEKLLEYQKKITDLEYTINILNWDLRIGTPKKAENNLIDLISQHQNSLLTLKNSSEYGKLIDNVIYSKEFQSLEEAEKRYIKSLEKDFQETKRIPSSFHSEYLAFINTSTTVWREAKEKNDYNMFQPYLVKIIEMTKKYYRYIDNNKNLYDVMLDSYEEGINTKIIDDLFSKLKEKLIPLLKKLGKQNKKDLNFNYTSEKLLDAAKFLLNYIGFDNDKGSLGFYPHGFTELMCHNDVRIAFRFNTNPALAIPPIIHEGGHGIFEQNIKPNLSRYTNSCIVRRHALHESQSRFFENILGRNKNFWVPIYDEFSKILGLNISVDEFVNNLNMVVPGLIRTAADELTYCLHIIIRYEIERDLFNDLITTEELPKIWNNKMKEYLGVEVTDDASGLMQDLHWSEGNFGYFPTYLLGNIYDGMLLDAINNDLGDINELLSNGEIKKITNYLVQNIYQYGGAFTFAEIIKKINGKEISVDPLIKYYKDKFDK